MPCPKIMTADSCILIFFKRVTYQSIVLTNGMGRRFSGSLKEPVVSMADSCMKGCGDTSLLLD